MDWGLLALIGLLGALALYLYGILGRGESLEGGLVLAGILTLAVFSLGRRAARDESTFDIANLLLLSFALHLVGAYFRFENAVDANVYFRVGSDLAGEFRAFNFTPDVGREIIGTGFLRYVAGLVEVVTFEDKFATFLLFSFGAFCGTYLAYRAFLTGLPDGDRYRYAKLVFLWPSMFFWPSSIGKEAWMITMLGLVALGAARLFTHRGGGLAILAVGTIGCAAVRPHVALIVVAAAFVAYLFRRETHGSTLRLAGKILAIVLLVIAAALAAIQTTEFLDLENLGTGSVDQAFTETETQTTQGGSAFTPARVRTPLHYPAAGVTVLLRPFPWEVRNAEGLLSAVEGLVLLALVISSVPRYRRLPRTMRDFPYVVFSLAFVAVFVYAFSVVGNFGILARQRTQVLPFVFVLLALPAVRDKARSRFSGRRRGRTRGEDSASPDATASSDPSAGVDGETPPPRRSSSASASR